jgi:hypothetical protein
MMRNVRTDLRIQINQLIESKGSGYCFGWDYPTYYNNLVELVKYYNRLEDNGPAGEE